MEKKYSTFHWVSISVSWTTQEYNNVTTLFSGHLWSLKTKENFHTFNSKSGCSHFREVVATGSLTLHALISSFCSMKGQEITPLEGLPPYSRLTKISFWQLSPSNKWQKLCGSKCQDKCQILVMPEPISIDLGHNTLSYY